LEQLIARGWEVLSSRGAGTVLKRDSHCHHGFYTIAAAALEEGLD
jgi:hypothetical protein